jgi:ABC-type branched-subunit amino acid transport system substrate-binding protein
LLLLRRCPLRYASLFAAFTVAALAGCAPAMVRAPIANPQSPYYGRFPPPPVPPAPPSALPPAAAGPAKVALLVPLSGANAELGQALLDAAQLALFESASDRLTLVPRDTAGGAASAARAVIGEGVRLILGPLLASEVEAVKPLARDAHLNVIAFSTVTNLAGGNVYLMGFVPRQEVVREVGYARQQRLDRFAALAPNSPYGHLMANALREAASASGGRVTKVEFYDPRAGDAGPAIQRLMPPGLMPPGLMPPGLMPPGLMPPGLMPSSQAAGAAPASTAPSAPAFDALLLPEGGDRLKQIARQVRAAAGEAKPVRLLGSGLWDVSDIGSDPALVGGWFASSSPEARQDFERRYSAAYGHNPPRLASLGYDAAALASALARGEGGEPFSQQAILNPSGFTGVDGLFRFTPGGLVQRGLAVLEVEAQGSVVVSPAPQSFQDLGY